MTQPAPRKRKPPAARGACLCGAVVIEIDVPVFWAWHDHGRASRLAHGAAYATYVGAWRSKTRIVKGARSIGRYEDKANGAVRSFCKSCGSPLIYERGRAPKMINLPRALFETRTGREPRYHLHIKEQQDWAYAGQKLVPLKAILASYGIAGAKAPSPRPIRFSGGELRAAARMRTLGAGEEVFLNPQTASFVFERIEAGQRARTLADLEAAMGPAFETFGFSSYAYNHIQTKGRTAGPQLVFGRTNLRWRAHYLASGHIKRDEMAAHVLKTSKPFTWDGYVGAHDIGAGQRRIMNETRMFGIRMGVVLPSHDLDGASGCLVLTSDARAEMSPQEHVAVHLLSMYFTQLGRQLALAHEPAPTLSKRQRECLLWVCAGKTDWEIGAILGISQDTVSEHLDAARRKLRVRTRAQAVAAALAKGLLNP